MDEPIVEAVVADTELWGIWCIELCAWCIHDGAPITHRSERVARDTAAAWQDENSWQVAHGIRPARAGVHDSFVGDGCMVPLNYEARPYTERSRWT